MNKSDAFAKFGVKLTNRQWSWSGKNDEGTIVALTFWSDLFGPRMMYEQPALTAEQRDSPGFPEFVRNVKHALDHCGGIVRVVINVRPNPNAVPPTILSSDPKPWSMRIVKFDPATGAFSAEQITQDGAGRGALGG